jgi:hypothetical protein
MKTITKIKNLTFVILLAALITIPLQSCKKYPEGPFISFRTRTARLAQTWKIESAKRNGSDYTSSVSTYIETYTKGGSYSYSWYITGGTGTWAFQNSDKEIFVSEVNARPSRTLTILRLETSSFWYYYMDGSDKYEFHMIPK